MSEDRQPIINEIYAAKQKLIEDSMEPPTMLILDQVTYIAMNREAKEERDRERMIYGSIITPFDHYEPLTEIFGMQITVILNEPGDYTEDRKNRTIKCGYLCKAKGKYTSVYR